jgi:hypothetical protein
LSQKKEKKGEGTIRDQLNELGDLLFYVFVDCSASCVVDCVKEIELDLFTCVVLKLTLCVDAFSG